MNALTKITKFTSFTGRWVLWHSLSMIPSSCVSKLIAICVKRGFWDIIFRTIELEIFSAVET